jgi:tetratricopeptide (TPR) repeat protein
MMIRRGTLILATLALVLVGLVSGMARAEVTARAALHEGFGRIVFDWTETTDYTATVENGKLRVTFTRPMDAGLDGVQRVLETYILGFQVDVDGLGVAFDLTNNFKVRAFKYESKVIVDVLDEINETAAVEPAPILDPTPESKTTETATAPGAETAPETTVATEAPATAEAPADNVGLGRVAVRTGDHPGFSRLVFDWPGAVDYSISHDGNQVTIRFDRAATVDLASFNASPPKFIHSGEFQTENGATLVTLQIDPNARLRHFRSDLKIVFDALVDPAASEDKTAEAPAEEVPVEATQASESPAAEAPEPATVETPTAKPTNPESRAVADARPTATSIRHQITASRQTATADKAPINLTSAEETPTRPELPPAHLDDGARVTAEVEPVAEPEPMDHADSELLPDSSDDALPVADTEPDLEALTALEPADFVDQVNDSQNVMLSLAPPAMKVTVETETSRTLVTFDGGDRVATAAFERNGYLWFVMAEKYDLDLESVHPTTKTGYLEIEDRDNDLATVVRFKLRGGYGATVRRRGVQWLVQFTTTPQPPEAVEIRVVGGTLANPRIQLPVTRIGRTVSLRDPSDRSTIDVVPLFASGTGIITTRRFSHLDLLATIQGVAINATGQIDIFTTLSGIEISGRPNQAVAEGEPTTVKNRARPTTALFDLVAWRRGDDSEFVTNRAALHYAVATASTTKLNDARLELARFLFSHGYMPEALGVVEVLLLDDPERINDPMLRTMRGVIYLNQGRITEAAQDLAGKSLDSYDDIAMWRGVLTMQQSDMKSAAAYFTQAGDLWLELPSPMRSRIGLMAAEAVLAGGDITMANAHLDVLRSIAPTYNVRERVKHLKGKLMLASGREEDAIALWRSVMAGTDRRARARAIYDDTMLMLENDSLTIGEATNEIEDLRYAWRGDWFELQLLQQLATLYISGGEYRKGLMSMKQAVTHFSEFRAAAVIALRMNELFAEIFLHDGAEDLSAVNALSLFYDFRELTPVGKDGDEVIQKLADRLVALDLLDRAAELLAHQIKYRLKGIDKARIGTRLAVIYLMNGTPERAIKVLRQSRTGKLPFDLATQRRHLRARALADLGRDSEALERLTGDTSRDAELLRADVFWRMTRWADVAETTSRLLDLTPTQAPLHPFASRQIMRLAVAYALADDRSGLDETRERFGDVMKNDPNQQAFDIITEDSSRLAADFRELPTAIAQVAGFEAFMANYRERVMADSLSAIN